MRSYIFVGLLVVAAGCGRPEGPEPAREKSAPIAAESKPSVEKKIGNEYTDWGPFAGLPKAVGPGSRYFRFASALWKELELDDSAWWGTIMPLASSRVSIYASVPARFGTHAVCLVEANTPFWPEVTLAFDGYPVTQLATPEKSQDGLRRMMQAIGKSLELSSDELRRIDLIVARIPIARHASGDGAIRAFVTHLPAKAHARMVTCVLALAEQKKEVRPSVEVPTVGFTLSDAIALELMFGLNETVGAFDQKAREIGTCWSLRITMRRNTEYTSLRESEAEPDGTTLFWPRLTLTEVEELTKRNGPGR